MMFNDSSNPSNYNSVTGGNFDLSNAFIGAGGAAVPLLSLAGGIYDSNQNRKVARENTDKTIAAQKAESELQYQRAVEMWNLQNAYNTPEAQMQRFKNAGLNPHLIYQQGNSGNASAPPNYQPAQQQYKYAAGNYGQALASILPMLMQVGTWMQSMKESEANIKLKEENIGKTGLQSEQLTEVINFLKQRHPQLLNQGELTIDKTLADILGREASTVKTHAEVERIYQMIDFLKERNPQLLQMGDIQNQLGLGKIELQGYQKEAAELGISKSKAQIDKLLRDIEFQYGKQGISSGSKQIEFIKGLAEMQLKEAQASWTDHGVTNPQGLMQLVLGAALGAAGIAWKSPKVNSRTSRKITNYEKGRKVERWQYEKK